MSAGQRWWRCLHCSYEIDGIPASTTLTPCPRCGKPQIDVADKEELKQPGAKPSPINSPRSRKKATSSRDVEENGRANGVHDQATAGNDDHDVHDDGELCKDYRQSEGDSVNVKVIYSSYSDIALHWVPIRVPKCNPKFMISCPHLARSYAI